MSLMPSYQGKKKEKTCALLAFICCAIHQDALRAINNLDGMEIRGVQTHGEGSNV